MNNFEKNVSDFFDTLTMDSDKHGHNYKILLTESIKEFLEDQNKDNAYAVYSMFFDVYRLNSNDQRSFVDLLDVLRGYEENTGEFNDSQRDHYIHSVNVFLLGICIYERNRSIRNAFIEFSKSSGYKSMYTSPKEEFLFCWGIASLFHDIGYPVEIINNQINKFISFIADDKNREIAPFISYLDFSKLNRINLTDNNLNPLEWEGGLNPLCPSDLISKCVAQNFIINVNNVKSTLDNSLNAMKLGGFVDHGYYSSIIILKWYGEELLKNDLNREILYCQITNAAAAIYLHNAYKNVFQKDPYELKCMKPSSFPLAYLLILCDEAQEWNRTAYGKKAKAKLAVDDSAVEISDDRISFHYVTAKGILSDEFLAKKKETFYKLLDINEVFPEGIDVTATTLSEQYIESVKSSKVLPRLLAKNIELLAKQIHADYCNNQLARNPGVPLEYPSWESLPDTLKYSNVRQAKTIVDKLGYIGCHADIENKYRERYMFSEEDVAMLAKYEHDLWVEERTKNGWVYGEEKDISRKISPYLIPFEELPDSIKELDIDTIKNIEPLLASVGLAIYK